MRQLIRHIMLTLAYTQTDVLPILRAGARSLRAIAENARGVATARGGKWQAMTVSNLLAWSGGGPRLEKFARAEGPPPVAQKRWVLFERAFGYRTSISRIERFPDRIRDRTGANNRRLGHD